ncbi:MAG: 2-hydroxyacid dehydrogenase [Tropicimonas sp.]|uniref:2-hydroxyacid dehydrogenase n=1 Tax=Tropicimonas sp. TaxID=2067044 RepID=UPI003A83D71C
MQTKIVVFMSNERQAEVARSMSPSGVDLQVFTKRGDPAAREALSQADVMVGTVPPFEMDDAFYESCPRLKLVQLLIAGYDKYDIDAARRAGVLIASNGGANANGVAEHAFMLMMALKRRLLRYHGDVVEGRWWSFGNMPPITDLNGATLGIVGFNTIGKRLARLARAFDMRVVYTDLVRLPPDEEDNLGVSFRLLNETLRESDVVSLHVPLLHSTRKMIGAVEFALMKPGAILINTSRGPVVDEAALCQALSEGQIAGAGLDVLEKEPPNPDNPLFSMDNVVLTPHQAGHIIHYFEPALRNAFLNAERVQNGMAPDWIIPELRQGVTAENNRILLQRAAG